MILSIMLKPSVALTERIFVDTGLAPKATNYHVEVEDLNLNLTEMERKFIFGFFIYEDVLRDTASVLGYVDTNFGHMPTTHEQALRCWLDYAGAYYTPDLIEIEVK